MINHSDVENTVYDITESLYWNKESLNNELDRAYDICIGCRLCFNLCPSFPSLFNAIDNAGDIKRNQAEEQGRVEKKEKRENYLDLPEGKHASKASIEVEFRGEISDLTNKQKWEIIDLCYQCKLCDPICPYTPGKEHEFQLDFPKLMTRAQAIRSKESGVKLNDKFLTHTDFIGFLGSLFPSILNLRNKSKFLRFMMEKMIGISRKRDLPNFQKETFEKWINSNNSKIKNPIDKVVIFGTCFTNAHDISVGKASVKILEHNNIDYVYPKQQCCGAPYLSPGDFNNFDKQAKPNLDELYNWVKKGYKIIVTGPPTCSLTLKQEYNDYLTYTEKSKSVSKNTFDISEYLFLLNKKNLLKTDFKNSIGSINYHVSCHLKAQKIGFKGRDIMRLVPDTKVKLINQCSGMDGGWGMKEEFFDESIKVAERCINDLNQKESGNVCSDCSLASHQIEQASKGEIKPSHPILELYKAYGFK